ncbi:MAG: sensor domain-containing diguanylate cyclase, partial [Desulfatitalea sp.]
LSLVNAGAQRGFLILEREGRLTIEVGEALEQMESPLTQPLPLEESQVLSQAIVNYVCHGLKPIILANATQQGEFTNDPYVIRHQCKSILCMPILGKGQLSGILYMENNLTANVFTAERLEILGIIAAQAAISLENARLFDLATTDGLTKLVVHRYFQLLVDKEIDRCQRYHRHFALVMMDIDNFKHFNDTYGHPLGDEVLKRVAQVLRDNIRKSDIAARYGGEEFVLILPETDTEQALIVCEKIRGAMQAMFIPHGEQTLRVTISLGAATFPYHAIDKQRLIQSADEALYASKRAGKNRASLGSKSGSRLTRDGSAPDPAPLVVVKR